MQNINFTDFRQTFQNLPLNKRKSYLNSLSLDELNFFYKNPKLFLFDKQIIEGDDWRYYLLMCGRSFGKTFSGSGWIAQKVMAGAEVIGLVGPSYKDVIDVMVKAIIAWFPPGEAYYVGGEKQKIFFKSYKAVIHCYSSDTEIRGPNLEFLWCDEICKWCDSIPEKVQTCFDLVDMAVRVGKNPQVIITSTPKPFPIFINWIKQANEPNSIFKVQTGTMFDNPFLPDQFKKAQIDKHGNTRLGRQELYGELLEDVEGALWSLKIIDDNRLSVQQYNQQIKDKELFINRTVISVDPAITNNENSDETGIMVVNFASNGHAYVIADYSGKYSPAEWARQTIKAFNLHDGDLIIAEKNQGGDLVASNIHTVDNRAPIKLVQATKGKILRAEPVSNLYERNKIHHVGLFKELEYQMCHFTGNSKEKSPDRLDSLVYAITELMLNKVYVNRDITNIRNYR